MNSCETLSDTDQQALLSQKINALHLKIHDTHLEEMIFQLHRELEGAGIVFKPETYLSNGWGCPNRVPVIGIPFYLADPVLGRLRTRMTGRKTDDDVVMMRLLRHEAGHTFNYAYRLYDESEWEALFGPFALPYRDEYRTDPASTRFVHHLPGCYAQKHPDDDFAETFAVWLTPCSHWQENYRNTPALEKLIYVDRAVAEYRRKSPVVTGGPLDMPVEQMDITLGEWFRSAYQYMDKRAARPRSGIRKRKKSR